MKRVVGLGLCALVALVAGCGPRVILTTGTTLGLKATPGDGQTRPPQVTLGYKRAELALVPTSGKGATTNSDAASTLAAFYFSTEWFGKTELSSFIGTGHAARDIQQEPKFQDEINKAAERFEGFRINNRAQLAAAGRITGTYAQLQDAGKRTKIRDKAVELGLVPRGTTDDAFARGKLQDTAVGGLAPTTTKFKTLEDFAAGVAAE